jgi:hypothetical protein
MSRLSQVRSGIVGGAAFSSWLWLILIVAPILALAGAL